MFKKIENIMNETTMFPTLWTAETDFWYLTTMDTRPKLTMYIAVEYIKSYIHLI